MGIFNIFKKKDKPKELTEEELFYKEYPIVKTLNSRQKRKLLKKVQKEIEKKKADKRAIFK